jgi:hypothetical protein
MSPEQLRSIQHYLPYLFALTAVWMVASSTIIGLLRRRAGLPVFQPKYPDAIFSQSWTSTGMANNCVWVILTPAFLEVRLHFPLCVTIPVRVANLLGLEAMVPLERVSRVEIRNGIFGGSMVAVSWNAENGPRTISVRVDKAEKFGDRLRAAAGAKGASI